MIILDSCILVFYTIRLLVSDKTIEQFEQDKRSFVNFDPVVVTDTALGGIISFAVFFSILKVFFLFSIYFAVYSETNIVIYYVDRIVQFNVVKLRTLGNEVIYYVERNKQVLNFKNLFI